MSGDSFWWDPVGIGQNCLLLMARAVLRTLLDILKINWPYRKKCSSREHHGQSSFTDSLRFFYYLFLEYVKKMNVPMSLINFSGIQSCPRIRRAV